MTENLQIAIAAGDVEQVAALIRAGADIHYRDEHGYDALINATYGRDVLRDPHLIELLQLLIANGASVTGLTTYGESAVRVLSRIGRFDAVRLLLDAGANPEDIKFTPLIAAVAFGTPADVEAVVGVGVDLEEKDWWERTAWLVAIQTGDIAKAQYLLEQGAQPDATGRCSKTPLFYAIENNHIPMLLWLLEIGIDVHQTDDFGGTALKAAAQNDSLEAVEVLLQAGADVNQIVSKRSARSALSHANGQKVALRLMEAGADPQELTSKARRAILGYAPDADPDDLDVSVEQFRMHRVRRFGQHNPEKMNNPFWEEMIRSGLGAYHALALVNDTRTTEGKYQPTWCAQRFGQSLTFLPDGCIVQIGGEHEDHYDPDFCIYSDVFVHDPAGGITIYGYPETVFPPTDFHTATLVDNFIYIIGSLGYSGARHYGTTPVYRLDVNTFQMERLETTGRGPGWIYNYRAALLNSQQLQITGGIVVRNTDGRGTHFENTVAFTLDIEKRVWRVATRECASPIPH